MYNDGDVFINREEQKRILKIEGEIWKIFRYDNPNQIFYFGPKDIVISFIKRHNYKKIN